MTHYVHPIAVSDSAIDENGHVNNVEYVRWMQEAATAHSDAAECTAATSADGATWFVRSHRIDYLRPALADDRIAVRTWVADMRRVASLRRYEILRAEDGEILAKGETDWVYVDGVSGRPRTIPDPIRAMFEVVSEP